MWIFSSVGFFSVVEKPEDRDTGMLTVRSRVKADLDALRERFMPELGPSIKGGGTDYGYRANIPREAFSEGMKRVCESIDYPNFKNAITVQQGHHRANIYSKVWTVLRPLEDEK